MKFIFVIDWYLIPSFIFCALTGIGLHIAGHWSHHGVWHSWAVYHVISSLLFLLGVVFHVKTHWGWYKSLFKNGLGKKSPETVVISAIFAVMFITGMVLLLIAEGGNTGIGLWHYKIGIASCLLVLWHVKKRINILKKSLK